MYAPDIVEIASLRGKVADVAAIAAACGVHLPVFGKAISQPTYLALSVRPERWLVLSTTISGWQAALSGAGIAVDQSSALAALHLRTAAARTALAAACRLDLDPRQFREGDAAATILFQVPAILVALSSGIVLLTASTTARHCAESLSGLPTPIAFERCSVQSLISSYGEALS